jgi:hypothetical protein
MFNVEYIKIKSTASRDFLSSVFMSKVLPLAAVDFVEIFVYFFFNLSGVCTAESLIFPYKMQRGVKSLHCMYIGESNKQWSQVKYLCETLGDLTFQTP